MTKERLTGRALDAALCTILEPKPGTIPKDAFNRVMAGFQQLSPLKFWFVGYDYTKGEEGVWCPIFLSTDLNACREAEAEIERQGLAPAYLKELLRTAKAPYRSREEAGGNPANCEYWAIVADAETRCRAMLAALEAK